MRISLAILTMCRALVLLASLFLIACTSTGQRLDDEALAAKLTRRVIEGTQFRHVVYANRLATSSTDSPLFVFIEGDGRPWSADGQHPSKDPTTLKPIALRLLLRTDQPAIYVSRPCYQQLLDSRCSAALWTEARYSQSVVASLVEAIRKVDEPDRALVLVGYSGGGVLAVLIAERLAQVTGVITVAANLDVDAWTREHKYLPLTQSLDPARSEATHSWFEIHLQGARDTNVPPNTTAAYFERHPAAKRKVLDAFDHSCCWVDAWPSLLSEITNELADHNPN